MTEAVAPYRPAPVVTKVELIDNGYYDVTVTIQHWGRAVAKGNRVHALLSVAMQEASQIAEEQHVRLLADWQKVEDVIRRFTTESCDFTRMMLSDRVDALTKKENQKNAVPVSRPQ